MKNNWNLSVLHSFIQDQVEENINLDYKAADALQKSDAKKRELAKDVSAMANSAGGTIIYGVKEFSDTALRHLPEKIDPILRSDISKEWIEHIISSHIHPKIEGVLISPVPVDDDLGTVVYVIDIPQSTTAHQSSDKRYYKRYNFESVAMEDYEIRDIMGRLKHPDIVLELKLEWRKMGERGAGLWFSLASEKEAGVHFECQLKIALRNKGRVFANYINYYLEIPSEIVKDDEHLLESINRPGYKEFYGENTVRDVIDVKLAMPNQSPIYQYGPSRYDPVLPGARSRFGCVRLIDNLALSDEKIFYWTIYADNAEIKQGSISLREISNSLK